MVKQSKVYQVEEIKTQLQASKSAALVDYQGLNANQITTLRNEITENGGTMEVIKNTLIQRAFESLGINLPEKLTGPTALICCEQDEITPLKSVEKSRQANQKPEFKYGVYQSKLLSLDELKILLALPSKDQLFANLLAGLQNPLSRLIQSLKFNQTKLVLTLKTASQKAN